MTESGIADVAILVADRSLTPLDGNNIALLILGSERLMRWIGFELRTVH